MDRTLLMKSLPLIALWALLLAGCQDFNLRLQSPDEVAREKADEALRGVKNHSALIGDYVHVSGLNMTILDGVGLVTNLNGTGDDPAASVYRTNLLDEMRKRQIPDPNQILRDPSTTLVLVRAYLPPLIKKSEPFDVEVYLPDGSEATSLKGGMLLDCELTDHAFVPGRGNIKGHRMAISRGAILTQGEDAGGVRRGVIPAGATYVGDNRNLAIYLRPDYKSVRMTQRIAQRIGQRFHDYDQYGIKRPLAEAKTDSKIELVVHSRYRDNYPRYLQCIRHILLRDTAVERHLRMQELQENLLIAVSAEKAALELEAIGTEAIPILKRGLESDILEVRFHAAQALAYLGQSEAAPVLREAADKEPAFRVCTGRTGGAAHRRGREPAARSAPSREPGNAVRCGAGPVEHRFGRPGDRRRRGRPGIRAPRRQQPRAGDGARHAAAEGRDHDLRRIRSFNRRWGLGGPAVPRQGDPDAPR